MPLAQPAVRQGWVAGANAAGARPEARYAGVTGTNAVKVFGLEVARTGLSLEEARSAGFDASTIEDESSTRAGYYPGGDKILTRIIMTKAAGCSARRWSGAKASPAHRRVCRRAPRQSQNRRC
jgi:NADPH-dependent 2,4-dienoyl-CoA reductase/sulfur reductase-like enzyme